MAARRATLILSCLQTLFEQSQDGVGLDDSLRALAEMLADHANAGEFEIGDEDFTAQARKELRSWIKLSLVVERDGRVYATDAFEEALRFASALGGRIMTSTASRLSVVQRVPPTHDLETIALWLGHALSRTASEGLLRSVASDQKDRRSGQRKCPSDVTGPTPARVGTRVMS